MSKSSRSDLARLSKRGMNVSMIWWNLSTNCSTVMPNVACCLLAATEQHVPQLRAAAGQQ